MDYDEVVVSGFKCLVIGVGAVCCSLPLQCYICPYVVYAMLSLIGN